MFSARRVLACDGRRACPGPGTMRLDCARRTVVATRRTSYSRPVFARLVQRSSSFKLASRCQLCSRALPSFLSCALTTPNLRVETSMMTVSDDGSIATSSNTLSTQHLETRTPCDRYPPAFTQRAPAPAASRALALACRRRQHVQRSLRPIVRSRLKSWIGLFQRPCRRRRQPRHEARRLRRSPVPLPPHFSPSPSGPRQSARCLSLAAPLPRDDRFLAEGVLRASEAGEEEEIRATSEEIQKEWVEALFGLEEWGKKRDRADEEEVRGEGEGETQEVEAVTGVARN